MAEITEHPSAQRLAEIAKLHGEIVQWLTAGMQSALIEWEYGKGADAAMRRLHNMLVGPDMLPDVMARDPDAWFKAHQGSFLGGS